MRESATSASIRSLMVWLFYAATCCVAATFFFFFPSSLNLSNCNVTNELKKHTLYLWKIQSVIVSQQSRYRTVWFENWTITSLIAISVLHKTTTKTTHRAKKKNSEIIVEWLIEAQVSWLLINTLSHKITGSSLLLFLHCCFLPTISLRRMKRNKTNKLIDARTKNYGNVEGQWINPIGVSPGHLVQYLDINVYYDLLIILSCASIFIVSTMWKISVDVCVWLIVQEIL